MYFLLLVSVLVISPVTGCLPQAIGPTNRASRGTWGRKQFCAQGSYAVGYAMKIAPNQGHYGDDTALNAIELVCYYPESKRFGGTATSTVGPYGNWTRELRCPEDMFLKEFALQVEEYQHERDDTAANYIKFKCGPKDHWWPSEELAHAPGHGFWGVMTGWTECPENSAICGIQTRVEVVQCGGDDTSLNDVKFYCCDDDTYN